MILVGNYTSYFLDEKFSVNGEELIAEDFDEDPTEIIDGEPQEDEMESPAEDQRYRSKTYNHVSFVSLFSEQIRLKYSECNVSLNQPLRS